MKELLQQRVTIHAETTSESVALVYRNCRMTYGELDRRSAQLARILLDIGCMRGDRVCLLMTKSFHAIVSILGILKADCTYVPIDPQNPAQRIRKVLDQCVPKALLVDGSVQPLLEDLLRLNAPPFEIAIGWLEGERPNSECFKARFTQADYEQYPSNPRNYENTPHDPAYIMFTSGSTGTPKGVVITHANVGFYLEWAIGYFGLTFREKMSSHPPLHFDLSVMDVFGALSIGAELHLIPQEFNLLPHKISDFIRGAELTHWFSVPSLLNYMAKFDVVKPNDFPALKRILWCGEVLPTPALMYWMKRLPHVTFTNLYGPTETTVASSYYTVPACPENENVQIPIGTACDGEELLVLDDTFNQTPVGEIGNLYIRGVGLSPGYWNDPEKTDSAFISDPTHPTRRMYKTGDLASVRPDGLVYFHGRTNTQIKSRGYRIELGEIEAVLHTIPGLHECAVVPLEVDGFESLAICCAYVLTDGHTITPHMLRQYLSRILPTYMLPTQYLALDALPKNPSGKIDRPQLLERFRQLWVRNPA